MIERICCALLTASVVAYSPVAASAGTLAIPFQLARDVPNNNGKMECGQAIPGPVVSLSLSSIYDGNDESHSTIDPKNKARYDKAIGQTREFSTFVTKNASNYTETDGNRLDAAACALRALDAWAKANALSDLKSRQSYLSVTRIIAGAALAYVQIKPAAELLDYDTSRIEAWLGDLAERVIPIYTQTGDRPSNRANHRYWGGLAVTSVGVAIGRKDFLEFGFESYKLGVCQVTAEGALPLELVRKKKARDYHLHAAGPLVMLASLLQVNGYDAFAQCGNALQRLVHFSLRSIEDPSLVEKLTASKQVALPLDDDGLIRGDRIAWLDAYLAQYPGDRAEYGKLFKEPLFSSNFGGRVSIFYNTSLRD